MDDTKIKVRILPLHNIGGVGMAGDVVWMSAADAEMYVRDGYVELLTENDPTPVPSQMSTFGEGSEDHKIMKPRAKRK
jgi:hypothetical protein